MKRTQSPINKKLHNLTPLWIISIFFSFTEVMLGYAVVKTQDGIQVALTVFVIVFPLYVASMFFMTLWCKPVHLYAPADFQDDSHFIKCHNWCKLADNDEKINSN